jgi:hypothetical protein
MIERSRILRAVTALLLLAIGTLASCTSLIGVDEYEGSAPALCGALAVCYGIEDCEQRIGSRLEQAPSGIRADWLRKFSDFECVSSCSAARRCLDFEPVCAYAGSCSRAEDCCGFIAGKSDCDGTECCAKRGASCNDDDDCCDASCSPITQTCGGVICVELGEPCINDFDCCTEICDFSSGTGLCSPEVCRPEGFECAADFQCCKGLSCGPDGRCTQPPCSLPGTPCGTGCCEGLSCVAVAQPNGAVDVCSDCDGKYPNGTICELDTECCSGRCDDEYKLCADASCPILGEACSPGNDCCEGLCEGEVCTCHEFDQPCLDNDDCCRGRCDLASGVCACSEGTCSDDLDCCSGSCKAGVCALSCAAPECHDECTAGGPLDSQSVVCGAVNVDPACIDSVCDELTGDPYCCCFAWDDLCVQAAQDDVICQQTGPCN